jgi:hypothetical protein
MRSGNILEDQDKLNDFARSSSPSLGGYANISDVHHARILAWFH